MYYTSQNMNSAFPFTPAYYGNLIFDADRGISAIRYNILNLPDTIQFSNGNQIVNLYDAAGRKYRSVTYTLPVTAVTPIYEIAHYNFSTDTIHFDVTEYTGNIERRYSRTDTTQRVFNTIGYYTDSTYYHYIKDHLGNICAVVNSMADTTIQSTIYYASGVPMVQSWGKDRQPYLYNGKEFIEAHDYNTYDYGFRGYYATIGRFTSVDPLTEQTPWQSPYAYAGNNFTNAIDWMGLSGVRSMSHFGDYNCIVTDLFGNIIAGVDDGDDNIYIDVDGKWNPDDGKDNLIWAATMDHPFDWYMSADGGGGIGGNILTSRQILSAVISAAMNGRLSITISASFGIQAGDKFFSMGESDLGLFGNLVSFELGSITLTNSLDDLISDYSFLGKGNRITVAQGFQLIIPTYESSFKVYASDLEYVPRSYQTNYSLSWIPYSSIDGNIHWQFSCGMFMVLAIEIIYQNQTPNNDN